MEIKFKKGDEVSHKKYGDGIVYSVSADNLLGIKFKDEYRFIIISLGDKVYITKK